MSKTTSVSQLKELSNSLNYGFSVIPFDGEYCLYKDLGNGYDIEVSGLISLIRSKRAVDELMANIYLWRQGEGDHRAKIIASSNHVDFCDIVAEVKAMYDYSYKYEESNGDVEIYVPVHGLNFVFIDKLTKSNIAYIRKVKEQRKIQNSQNSSEIC